MDDSRPFLASGKLHVLLTGCMLSRFTVMMCVSIEVVEGKLRFLSGRPRDFWNCFFLHSFSFLGANCCNLFYD